MKKPGRCAARTGPEVLLAFVESVDGAQRTSPCLHCVAIECWIGHRLGSPFGHPRGRRALATALMAGGNIERRFEDPSTVPPATRRTSSGRGKLSRCAAADEGGSGRGTHADGHRCTHTRATDANVRCEAMNVQSERHRVSVPARNARYREIECYRQCILRAIICRATLLFACANATAFIRRDGRRYRARTDGRKRTRHARCRLRGRVAVDRCGA